jgi:ferric-dicitrate binding protein FerR (iron transport regulator)
MVTTLVLNGAVLVFSRGEKEASAGASTPASIPGVLRGKVVYLEGQVEIDGLPAELGTELGLKAIIRTGVNSYCDIVFADKNAVRVTMNAVASLDFSGPVIQVDLERGGVTAVLRKLQTAADQDSFRVKSPSAAAGVRGTSFRVWSDGTESYICACNGTVRTIDAQGSNESVLSSTHHTAVVYSPSGQGYSATTAALLHHTDKQVESLAARIGETIDWTKMD